jgi:hypothetical protein
VYGLGRKCEPCRNDAFIVLETEVAVVYNTIKLGRTAIARSASSHPRRIAALRCSRYPGEERNGSEDFDEVDPEISTGLVL